MLTLSILLCGALIATVVMAPIYEHLLRLKQAELDQSQLDLEATADENSKLHHLLGRYVSDKMDTVTVFVAKPEPARSILDEDEAQYALPFNVTDLSDRLETEEMAEYRGVHEAKVLSFPAQAGAQ